MDTRTRTASPTADNNENAEHATPPPAQDKISAYYSLVFPHFTFYIQTLSITIGRRCAPNAATSSTAETSPVDVDLGALKSVSRLHAKIEYDQDEDRFVLVVTGRNGAWVDGVWSGMGTRAPLGERSQIQIASRTFHFVLPPPPPPEDTPSPSSQSSANRPRSPSVDITSISPPSSQPSNSPPPPVKVKLRPPSPEPQPPAKGKLKPHAQPQPELPNSNSIGKANSKKRKKIDVNSQLIQERPRPEDIPPKPLFTYAQLIYRAIKDLGGKATLQEICTWIMNNHEYYRYADTAWMSSVRHNLSSSRAFLKMERCGGDRGKGFFWSVHESHSQSLEEQELKARQAAAAAAQGGSIDATSKSRKKERGALLEPALKRSVKGDTKGALLPPPLTCSPLPFKTPQSLTAGPSTMSISTSNPGAQTIDTITPSPVATSSSGATTGVFAYPSHQYNSQAIPQQGSTQTSGYSSTPMNGPNPYAPLAQSNWVKHVNVGSTSSQPPPTTSALAASSSHGPQPGQTAVPDVVIPIILGPIPPTHPDYSSTHRNNSAKEGYMILHERKLILDPDIFAELTKEMLEKLEAMGAREALKVLTDHMIRALKERRARDRGKQRGNGRPRGRGGRRAGAVTTGPFTNLPLEHKRKTLGETSVEAVPVEGGSPLIIVDDESENEGRASKKRKTEDDSSL